MVSSRFGSIRGVLEARHFPVACFALFVAVRLLMMWVPVEPTSDFAWYFNRAGEMLAGRGYSENGMPTAFWPIGYPAFLAGAMATVGSTVLAGQLANLALAGVSFWLTYWIAKRIFADELVARLAVLLLAIYPNNAAFVSLLASETLFTFLLLLATALLLARRGWTNLIASGVAFGMAILVKSQVLLMIVPIATLALASSFTPRELATCAGKSLLVVVIALACVMPWTARNISVMGAPILVSTNGGFSLLCGNNPSVVGDYRSDFSCEDPLFEGVRFSVRDQVAADSRARAIAVEWISDNPGTFVAMFPKKLFRLWAPDGEAEWAYQAGSPAYEEHATAFRTVRILNQVFYIGILLGALLGIWFLVSKRVCMPSAYIGVAIALVLTAISLIFSGQSRYHFPAMLFLIMYASLAAFEVSRQVGKRGA